MKLAAGKCGVNKRRWLSTPCRAELRSILPQAIQDVKSLHTLAKCSSTNSGMKKGTESS